MGGVPADPGLVRHFRDVHRSRLTPEQEIAQFLPRPLCFLGYALPALPVRGQEPRNRSALLGKACVR